jgi:hypothetical protein
MNPGRLTGVDRNSLAAARCPALAAGTGVCMAVTPDAVTNHESAV